MPENGRVGKGTAFRQDRLSGGKALKPALQEIPVEASKVTLPPYYPRHPEVLEDWAAYLDTFSLMDKQVGQIVDRLAEGEFENTVLFHHRPWSQSHGASSSAMTRA